MKRRYDAVQMLLSHPQLDINCVDEEVCSTSRLVIVMVERPLTINVGSVLWIRGNRVLITSCWC